MAWNGHYSFRGNGSFIQNGYVCYTRGYMGSNGWHSPNQYAVEHGERTVHNLLSTNSNTHHRERLVKYLRVIAQREQAKEQKAITAMLNQISPRISADFRSQVEQFVQSGDMNSAYTLITRFDTEARELKEESQTLMQTGQLLNFQHTNKLWGNTLAAEFENIINELFSHEGNQIFSAEVGAHQEFTIDMIVERFFNRILSDCGPALLASAAEQKENFKKALTDLFVRKEILKGNEIDMDIFPSVTELKKRFDLTKAKGELLHLRKYHTKGGSTGITAKDLNDLCRGMAMELVDAAGFDKMRLDGKKNLVALNTGAMRKAIETATGSGEVQIKADNITFFSDTVELDEDRLADIFSMEDKKDQYDKLMEYVKEINELPQFSQVFMIQTNVKGYQSRFDLQIEGRGSFESRVKKLSSIPALSQERIPLHQNLLFLLNNTVKGAVCDDPHYKDRLGVLLASACVGFFWDDFQDLLAAAPLNGNVQTIHLFDSGGAYITASQILKATADRLEQLAYVKERELVQVEILPPDPMSPEEYLGLQETYPVTGSEDNYAADQAQLALRWGQERNRVARNGQLAIRLDQMEVEKLLAGLRQIL